MPRITPLSLKKYKKFLKHIGCIFKGRGKGDHLIYKRADLKRPIVAVDDKEVPVFHIIENNKTLGLNREEYLQILAIL